MKNLQEAGVGDILCLNSDGRRDKTKFMTCDEETGKYYKAERMEEHYSLTTEPSGKYADHLSRTLQPRMKLTSSRSESTL